LQSNRFQISGETRQDDQGGDRPEGTLAERLLSGPLPLPVALQYAADIAASLRELHRDGRTHGCVNAAAIVLISDRAVLQAGSPPRETALPSDIAGFGAVLYEMINGRKPAPGLPLLIVDRTFWRAGLDGLKMAANQLASRCLSGAAPDIRPDIRKVAPEVRLLKLLALQLAVHPPKPRPQPQALQSLSSEPVAEAHPAAAGEIEVSGLRPVDRSISARGRCPRCGSLSVHVSRSRTLVESLLNHTANPVWRCHRCCHRYFRMLGIDFAKSAPGGNLRKNR
jgi:hypothetical protein